MPLHAPRGVHNPLTGARRVMRSRGRHNSTLNRVRVCCTGGNVGLMGEVARAVRDGGGAVLGVIPKELMPREVSGAMIGETRIARDMHDRKATMAAESDAFIALPGGFGTLEELLEVVTWQQLGYHSKPVGVLNISDFYRHFLTFLDHCETQVRSAQRALRVFYCSMVRLQ